MIYSIASTYNSFGYFYYYIVYPEFSLLILQGALSSSAELINQKYQRIKSRLKPHHIIIPTFPLLTNTHETKSVFSREENPDLRKTDIQKTKKLKTSKKGTF